MTLIADAWNNLNQLQNQTDGPVTGDTTQKTTAFTYTPAGQVQTQQQPNGNLITDGYTAAGQVYTQAECTNKTSPVIPAFPITSPTAITCGTGGQLVSADAYTYDVNGEQTQDLSSLMSADSTGTSLSHTWNDTYNPVGQLTQVSDGSTQTEAYQHDPQGDIISQTIGNTSAAATTYSYSRGLLQSSATSGQASTYNYDPLGRLDTVTGLGGTIQQSSTYDGFDNLIFNTQGSGTSATKTTYNYDPLNRVTSQATGSNTTSYSYLGLTSQVSSETDPGKITKTYGYTPGGTRLFQTTAGNPTASLNGTAYYSYNNHGDVQALTGPAGTPTATYGYTAYGSPAASMFTGADAGKASPGPNVVPYNSNRFNAMPWDPGSGQYNMGFRNYAPGLGSFTSRDMYAGSGADMALTGDPFSGGAYAFGDANPISNIELDGHCGGPFGFVCSTITGALHFGSDFAHGFVSTGLGLIKGTWQMATQPIRDLSTCLGGSGSRCFDFFGDVTLVRPVMQTITGAISAVKTIGHEFATGHAGEALGSITAIAAAIWLTHRLGPAPEEAGIPAGSTADAATSGSRITPSVRGQYFQEGAQPPTCSYCQQNPAEHLDHVIPRSQGGDLSPENLTPACSWCNQSKGARVAPVNPPPGFVGEWPPLFWPSRMLEWWYSAYGGG